MQRLCLYGCARRLCLEEGARRRCAKCLVYEVSMAEYHSHLCRCFSGKFTGFQRPVTHVPWEFVVIQPAYCTNAAATRRHSMEFINNDAGLKRSYDSDIIPHTVDHSDTEPVGQT